MLSPYPKQLANTCTLMMNLLKKHGEKQQGKK